MKIKIMIVKTIIILKIIMIINKIYNKNKEYYNQKNNHNYNLQNFMDMEIILTDKFLINRLGKK